ncbi:MAG: DOMON-like domain-containing protein [Pseudomonadales bacterium]|nr:DOMON-like domain-containing protein [Pseudomonadales bacterium]
MQQVKLIPFKNQTNYQISVQLDYQQQLRLRYNLFGKLDDINIPLPTNAAVRRDNLWQHTCFECFIKSPANNRYWEFNFSPGGDWNCYQFESYRQGMSHQATAQPKMDLIYRDQQRLQFEVMLEIPSELTAQIDITVGLAAVLKIHDNSYSYWALQHSADQPDFHRQEDFIFRL